MILSEIDFNYSKFQLQYLKFTDFELEKKSLSIMRNSTWKRCSWAIETIIKADEDLRREM